MKMQTMRNLMSSPDGSGQVLGDAVPESRIEAAVASLPQRPLMRPMSAFSMPVAPLPVVALPKIQDFAQKKACEAYLNIMAGVGYRAQLGAR